MSQHDTIIDNGPGASVRSDINAAIAALFSSSSGPLPPAVTFAGQFWLDTSTPGATIIRIRDIDNAGWVDISTGGGTSLPISGGTMTGPLLLAAGEPSGPTAAAPKSYVDNLAAGLDVKQSCRLASTGNLPLTGLANVDGGTPVAGDRILAKDQTAPAANGIYIAAAGAWARASDMDSWSKVPGANVWIEQGTINADKAFVCTADQGGVIGTTPIVWALFGGSGVYQLASAVLASIAALTTGDGVLRLNTGVASLLVIATVAQWLANAPATGVLTSDAVWSSAAPKALTDAATIAIDMAQGSNFNVTLNVAGATRVLGFPSTPKVGQTGWIEVIQDGTGGRLLTFASGYKWPGGAAGLLSTGAGAIDMLFYVVRGAADIRLSLTKAWA